MGVFLLISGVILRVFASQFAPEENVPEWLYDLDAVGNALCSSFNLFLSIAACRYLPKIKLLHLARAVSAVYLFIVSFDCVKELVGYNQDNSWQQVAFFCSLLSLILVYQYHVYKRDTATD